MTTMTRYRHPYCRACASCTMAPITRLGIWLLLLYTLWLPLLFSRRCPHCHHALWRHRGRR